MAGFSENAIGRNPKSIDADDDFCCPDARPIGRMV